MQNFERLESRWGSEIEKLLHNKIIEQVHKQEIILSSIPMDQLKSELSDTIKKEFQQLLSIIQPIERSLEFLSRKQAAKLLGVSLVTLSQWTKTGKLQGYRIASRVRYKRAELETSLAKIKTSSK